MANEPQPIQGAPMQSTTAALPTSPPQLRPPGRFGRGMRALARASGAPTRLLAGSRVVPLWAIIHHTGRKSGQAYATSVAIGRTGDGFVIPLPFGSATQWAQNVVAAGGCTIRWRGHDYAASAPALVTRAEAAESFRLLRPLVRRIDIATYLRVTARRI